VAVVFKCLFVIGGSGVVFHNEIFAEQGRLFVDSRRDNGDFFAVSQRGLKRRQQNCGELSDFLHVLSPFRLFFTVLSG
ncbi:MAG: hypothetical protein II514_03710, partial [Ruminococcus sp.]|nr:hypothetical protein [Ruminococcus sp.]